MELSLQIAPGSAAAPPRRPRVLVGFAEALAAIESAWQPRGRGGPRGGRLRPPAGLASPAARRSSTVAAREPDAARDSTGRGGREPTRGRRSTRVAADAVMPLDDVALALCQGPWRRRRGGSCSARAAVRPRSALDKRLTDRGGARGSGIAVLRRLPRRRPVPATSKFLVVRLAGALPPAGTGLRRRRPPAPIAPSSTAAWRAGGG